jgi:zinc transporter ZupT
VAIRAELWHVVVYGALAGAATLSGVLAVVVSERWAVRHLPHLLSFASGVLTTGALLRVAGEATELAGTRLALYAVALSFAALALLEMRLLPPNGFREAYRLVGGGGAVGAARAIRAGRRRVALAIMAPLALLIHSTMDGLAVGVSEVAGAPLGILFVVLAHEVPEGLAAVSAQLSGGVPRRTALRRSIAIALSTPAAAIAGYLLLENADERVLGILLGVAAGSFLHAGATDLLPESETNRSYAVMLLFLVGVALMVGADVLAVRMEGR